MKRIGESFTRCSDPQAWFTFPKLGVFTMIGAEEGPHEHGLEATDYILRRDMLSTVAVSWGVPEMVEGRDAQVTEIINREHPDLTKRADFLDMQKADFLSLPDQSIRALALCNIPESNPYIDAVNGLRNATEMDSGHRIDVLKDFVQPRDNLSVHRNHTDYDLWRSQIQCSDSSIVFLYGDDGFKPGDIVPDGYFVVPGEFLNGVATAIAVRWDFLENITNVLASKELASSQTQRFFEWAVASTVNDEGEIVAEMVIR